MNFFKKALSLGLLLGAFSISAKEEAHKNKKHHTVTKIRETHTTKKPVHHVKDSTRRSHALHHESVKAKKLKTHHATTTKTSSKSTLNKIRDLLAGGGIATAAHTAAASGIVHHRGPEGFFEQHNFPQGWNYGWTGQFQGTQWLFGGYDLNWWKQHYPAYYRDVVRPEYTKAGGK